MYFYAFQKKENVAFLFKKTQNLA